MSGTWPVCCGAGTGTQLIYTSVSPVDVIPPTNSLCGLSRSNTILLSVLADPRSQSP